LGLDFGPWEVEAISELTKYVRGVLRRDYHEVAMQVAAPLVNLTPHPVVVLGENDEVLLTIPVSGLPVPRASKTTEVVAEVEMNGVHIPLVRTRFGAVENLPEPVKGTAYIVSLIVKQACPDRRDLRIVEDVVRDGSVIKGCRAFGI
jgi:hypothetical protein